jgi:hypothetical protein
MESLDTESMRRSELSQPGMLGRRDIYSARKGKSELVITASRARASRVSLCGKCIKGWKGLLPDEQGIGLNPIGRRQRSSEVFLGTQE